MGSLFHREKSATSRLQEILGYLNGHCEMSRVQETAMRQMAERKGLTFERIAGLLSLGRWRKFGWDLRVRKDESLRRKGIRSLAFVKGIDMINPTTEKIVRTLGHLRQQGNLRKDEIDREIKQILAGMQDQRVVPQTGFGETMRSATRTIEPDFQPSFEGDKKEFHRNLARESIKHASRMISQSWPCVVKAQTPGGAARNYYERCFGTFNNVRYQRVKGVLKAVHDVLCRGELDAYLRTSAMIGKQDDAPGTAEGDLIPNTILTPNGAYPLSTLFAWATPAGPGGAAQIYFCDAFFRTNGLGDEAHRLAQESDRGKGHDNVGGVLIHELTHSICGTRDVNYNGQTCYGRTLCTDLKNARPNDAVENADNYEIFCEDIETLDHV